MKYFAWIRWNGSLGNGTHDRWKEGVVRRLLARLAGLPKTNAQVWRSPMVSERISISTTSVEMAQHGITATTEWTHPLELPATYVKGRRKRLS